MVETSLILNNSNNDLFPLSEHFYEWEKLIMVLLDAAAMLVRSFVYVIHILQHLRQLFFDTEREYKLLHLPVFHR